MDIEKRINAFVRLGNFLRYFSEDKAPGSEVSPALYKEFEDLILTAYQNNGWFIAENVKSAVASISEMLSENSLRTWISSYQKAIDENNGSKKIGVIMAGNVPLVGFHDMLCVLISGNVFVGKLSSNDRLLLPKLTEVLIEIEPGFKEKIIFTEKLENIDAVIATGSDNTARYFEYYFSKYPHIIRKNRNSVAVITGDETQEELKELGNDIFLYFGLGCRNVSKLFIPEGYDLDKFFNAIYGFKDIVNHNKYGNNYDYNKTIYMLNGAALLENGFLILKEDKGLSSPVAVLFYEHYRNESELQKRLETEAGNIQCVVGKNKLANVEFGKAQCPGLNDYADNIDTMEFLLDLK